MKMPTIDDRDRLRREQDILDRLENVKRLIQMKTTLMTSKGAEQWRHYCWFDFHGQRIRDDYLLGEVEEEIEIQLLSIVALCRGDNPDIGEPMPMLEFNAEMYDRFFDVWDDCLHWNI